ncbi:MAG: hypothetical protein E7274_04990 [Pseudobutyrivibrio ruminis]|uniref:CIS tube protein n=1 Tax=Pseudobutyrivibrio ruminis TaxID=46206 RepID=UPI0026EBAD8F|nr:hypothetical protein [Pseudobutyrivibrio ruminis]MBE5913394.1 hypothetical protein [Pseudobutyrivibrio ruminis]
MGFFGGFNRAQIGFPLKKGIFIDGVKATNAATDAVFTAKKLADATQYYLQRKVIGLTNGVNTSGLQDELIMDTASNFYWLEVEFNPSTLRYTARNGSQQQQSVTGDMAGHIAQYNVDAETKLHFEMYVDSAICLSASTGATLSTAISAGMNIFKGRDYYNIAPIVDGLCSLCHDFETQYVIFAWGKMAFYGILEEVNADYVMFDTDGKPIRAKVSVGIRQSGKTTKDEGEESFLSKSQQYWDDVYKNYFGKGNQEIQIGTNAYYESIKDYNNLLNLK